MRRDGGWGMGDGRWGTRDEDRSKGKGKGGNPTSWSLPLILLSFPIRLDLLLRHLPRFLIELVGLRVALQAEREAKVGVGDLGYFFSKHCGYG